jgi:predicted enzyme related to lactoylglutathione lyase
MKLKLPDGRTAACWLQSAALLVFVSPGLTAEPPPLPPVTSVSGSPRLPGKFVWADLVTDDVVGARRFYGDLFNWTFRDLGGYVVAANEERPLCGIFHRDRPADRPQARPRWFGYVSVSSVEKAKRAVMQAGGRVLAAPRTLPKRGEQAIFADTEGALFGVMKSASGDPPDFMAEPGDWIWVQLLSRDARKASEFYRAVGGYEVIENTAGNRLSDYVLASKGYARATVRTIPESRPQVQPSWLPFVRVKSVRESVALAKRLGGKTLLEPKPELFEGRVAVVADPAGAAIGLLEWSDSLVKGGR